MARSTFKILFYLKRQALPFFSLRLLQIEKNFENAALHNSKFSC